MPATQRSLQASSPTGLATQKYERQIAHEAATFRTPLAIPDTSIAEQNLTAKFNPEHPDPICNMMVQLTSEL